MNEAQVLALIEEATKKSGLVWLQPDGRRTQAVWHLWHEGSAYVLSGGDEQPAPGLGSAELMTVAVRSKDNGGRVVVWEARVELVPPESDVWRDVVPLLQAKRLNLPDGEAAPARWAGASAVHRLAPTGRLLESPTDPDNSAGAAAPPETPATSRVPIPFTLGRRWTRGRTRNR